MLSLLVCGCSQTAYPYEESDIADISFVTVDKTHTITVLHSLGADNYSDFLLSLSEMEVCQYWNDPIEETEGNNIMITFVNGDYHLINASSTSYWSNGNADFQRIYYAVDIYAFFWARYADCE